MLQTSARSIFCCFFKKKRKKSVARSFLRARFYFILLLVAQLVPGQTQLLTAQFLK